MVVLSICEYFNIVVRAYGKSDFAVDIRMQSWFILFFSEIGNDEAVEY